MRALLATLTILLAPYLAGRPALAGGSVGRGVSYLLPTPTVLIVLVVVVVVVIVMIRRFRK